MNENDNNIRFSRLLNKFPEHFINILPIEILCTATGLKQNIYQMDLIDGITLWKFIYSEETSDDLLENIIKQMVYVLTWLNINGYYHNDLKLDNIMIVSSTETNILYNQLDIKMELTNVKYVFKLIDYSTAVIFDELLTSAYAGSGNASHTHQASEAIELIYLVDAICILLEIGKLIEYKKLDKFIKSSHLIKLLLGYLNVNLNSFNDLRLLDKKRIIEKAKKLTGGQINDMLLLLKST